MWVLKRLVAVHHETLRKHQVVMIWQSLTQNALTEQHLWHVQKEEMHLSLMALSIYACYMSVLLLEALTLLYHARCPR